MTTESSYMRTFELHRIEDETGISGTGIIAEGIIFTDGTCALRWKTVNRSTGLYDDIETLEKIHGHGGKTKIVHTGAPFERGFTDAAQDMCENAPFASIGGLEKRAALAKLEDVAPSYLTQHERARWCDGYRAFAMATYGRDWATCAFGWSHALTIPEKEPADAPR